MSGEAQDALGRALDALLRRDGVIDHLATQQPMARDLRLLVAATKIANDLERSEEHTSELQSQSNLVCRLLLEKKKKNRQRRNNNRTASIYNLTYSQPRKTSDDAIQLTVR